MLFPQTLIDSLKPDYTVYDGQAVREAWQANTDYAHIQLLLVDSKYRTIKTPDWERVFKESDTRQQKYVPEFHDCDDFAFLFKGEITRLNINGCGLVLDFSGKHAFNVCLIGDDPKKVQFRFTEPQDDSWIIANSKPYYNLKGSGLVIL